MHAFLHGSYEGTLYALEYIRSNFVLINGKLETMDELFEGVGKFLTTQEQFDVLQLIETENRGRLTPSVSLILNRELVTARTNVARLTSVENQVNPWLQQNVDVDPGLGSRLSVGGSLVALLLSLVLALNRRWI